MHARSFYFEAEERTHININYINCLVQSWCH